MIQTHASAATALLLAEPPPLPAVEDRFRLLAVLRRCPASQAAHQRSAELQPAAQGGIN